MSTPSPLPVMQPGVGLPGINRPLDNTALSMYMTCPREYYFGMVLHRRAGGLSPALAYGRAWHLALEHHYRTGGQADLVELFVRQKWQDHGAVDDYRTLERVLLDYKRYRERWGADPSREDGKTVGWPVQPMVEVQSNTMSGGLVHSYTVKIDRIIELNSLGYVEDHKTTSRLDRNYWTQFELSNQMMGYVFQAQQLAPSLRIVGVRINVCHVLKTGTNFERQLFTYTPDQLREWVRNTNYWMQRLNADALSWEHLGDGEYPVAHFGENGCSRKYGMCSYHHACSRSARMRQTILDNEYPLNPWNPLEVDGE